MIKEPALKVAFFVLYDNLVKAKDTVKTAQVNISGPSGTERVYVIMSLKRQQKLEGLIHAQITTGHK